MMPANLTPTGFSSLSLEAQIDIVKNADLYDKRIKAIKEAEASEKAEREKLTKAKDIDLALKQAKQIEEAARDALNQARTESTTSVNQANERANQILKESESKARQIVASANQSITEILSQTSEKQVELADLHNQVGLLSQKIELLTENHNGLMNEVRTKESEKAKLLEVIADKQRKLKALMVE